jgi:phage shock protein PspC (stress-responsive transcriptional regulator)
MEETYMATRLYRSRKDRLVGGVCGGLGAYFGIDPVIVRLVFVVLSIWGGLGFLGYLILWIVIPPEERSGALSQDVIGSNVAEIEQRAQEFAHEASDTFSGRTSVPAERTMFAAVALIVVGALLLVGNVFMIPIGRLWPALLVLLGVFLIYQAAKRG